MTLTELMVTMVVGGVVIGGAMTAGTKQQRVVGSQINKTKLEQQLSLFQTRITQHIQGAGFNPKQFTFDTFTTMSATKFVTQSDRDMNGEINANEITIYDYVDNNITVNGSALCTGIESIQYKYLDAGGAPTTDSALVRSLQISITNKYNSSKQLKVRLGNVN